MRESAGTLEGISRSLHKESRKESRGRSLGHTRIRPTRGRRGVRDTRESVLHGAGPEGLNGVRDTRESVLHTGPGWIGRRLRGRWEHVGVGDRTRLHDGSPPASGLGGHCTPRPGWPTERRSALLWRAPERDADAASDRERTFPGSGGVAEGFGVRRPRCRPRPGLGRAGASPGTAGSGRRETRTHAISVSHGVGRFPQAVSK